MNTQEKSFRESNTLEDENIIDQEDRNSNPTQSNLGKQNKNSTMDDNPLREGRDVQDETLDVDEDLKKESDLINSA